jgi:dTDP-4-dehydrorhamnose 3,5-epimerase
MIFHATNIAGVVEIEAEPHRDARGFFARLYCPEELARAGLDFVSTQINLSRNEAAYTLRGMHWQDPPCAEAKIVRVVSGAVHDVVIDLRPDSATFRRWIARRLDAERANALLVPEGCAHGFLTLEPCTDVLYQMSRAYVPGYARGLRYDDPDIGIVWPGVPKVIADADLDWPCPWTLAVGLRRGCDA